jgi:hypothetical protein
MSNSVVQDVTSQLTKCGKSASTNEHGECQRLRDLVQAPREEGLYGNSHEALRTS